jgi:hypothetical protein
MSDASFAVQTLLEGDRRIRRRGQQQPHVQVSQRLSRFYTNIFILYASSPLKRRWKEIAGLAGEASSRSMRKK